MKLKVLALGKKNVIARITRALHGSDISVTGQTEVSEALNLLKKEKFDLALVDAYMNDIETNCYRISWLCRTPIALVINGGEDDWEILRKLDADGFIPEEAENVELISYFTAIAKHITEHVESAKILLIEDDDQIMESLRLSFKMYWPEVELICASTGMDGIRQAKEGKIDVILLDLILPDLHGAEVLDKIRVFSQTPVLIVTANRNQEDIIRCMRGGANDFMVKPFKHLELLSRIRKLINVKEPVTLK
jgi:DNA-binding response OmpR family regulator